MRRRTGRPIPTTAHIRSLLESAAEHLPDAAAAGVIYGELNELLKGEAGVRALLADHELPEMISAHLAGATAQADQIEAEIGAGIGDNLESRNQALTLLRDAVWAIERDRLRTAREVGALARPGAGGAALAAFLSIQQSLSALDRLEVRGRDSAGLHVLVRNHHLDLDDPEIAAMVTERRDTSPLFTHTAVRTPDGLLSFVYKAAAEIGELGDNTATMREAIVNDQLLARALADERAEATVLGHTRWASIGIISEPNAHPVNSEETGTDDGPYVLGVLNGDVDNFADIIAAESLQIQTEITTDAKVIPTTISRNLASGQHLDEAVRSAVAQFEGSVAIGVSTSAAPSDLHLCLRGSGQGVFIGRSEEMFVVASEPYGVVEDAVSYLRMDGETPADPDNPTGSQGQIIRLSGGLAGHVEGVSRISYDGTPLPIDPSEWIAPEVTTRDIDRGDAPHFLLKEIMESPESFRKTLRGRLTETADGLVVGLAPETLSLGVLAALESGTLRRIFVIGQGTAAIAGRAVAGAFQWTLAGTGIPVIAITATELSGFGIDDDMSDCLIVAISQSGTTTDTNRTVDILRARGATVLAIVNRRGSDLVDKSDGVLYTSDGRDVEMSVASTKAFYAQIAAGFLLAVAVSDHTPTATVPESEVQSLLQSLKEMPDAMVRTIAKRDEIAVAAGRHVLSRRYWAMVGNGPNFVAANEVRIKLSELCYKSIACDITEDKKHIDLSSEPLIFVCAAGLQGSNADDVAKEVAIFRAHEAAPIVVATEGENRFKAALEVISVPETHEQLAFVLSTVVGHLFGYEAALAIDASARPLREARGLIEQYVNPTDDRWFTRFGRELEPFAQTFFDGLRTNQYNGHLEASTAVKVASMLRFAMGQHRFETYQLEFGKVGTPGVIADDLAAALTEAIEELTRPVDAIKHQAKTVTVGISRSDESLLQTDLVKAVLATGCPRDRLTYRVLRTLSSIDPAVADVVGHTRYRIEGDPERAATLHVVDKVGIAAGLVSRAERDPVLRGNKHRVAAERAVLVTVGSDGRVVLIVPEVKDSEATGITLCHLKLAPALDTHTARAVLQGYRSRYRGLVDVVTEREPTFRDDLLADVPVVDILTAPISDLAIRWIG
ncbi:MAG: SIS domain-containing protein [Acidimicrobiales bacterium]